MKLKLNITKAIFILLFCFFIHLLACVNVRNAKRDPKLQDLGVNLATQSNHYSGYLGQSERSARSLLRDGKRIFRYETFGDEVFWSDKLEMHRSIAGDKYGGVGPGLKPIEALQLGLKVDRKKLTPPVAFATKLGLVPLDKTFITMLLLKMNAVVGVRAKFKGPLSFKIKTIGIT